MNSFKQTSLKANPEKVQSMLISSHGCDVEDLMIDVDNAIVSSTERMKVLGVKIAGKLNFTVHISVHISDVCIKTG